MQLNRLSNLGQQVKLERKSDMAIGPEFAQYGYWGVAVAGLVAVVLIVSGARETKSIIALICVVLIIVFSVAVAITIEIGKRDADLASQQSKTQLEYLARENADLKYKIDTITKSFPGGITVHKKDIIGISDKITETIKLVRGAATNTSDAQACTANAFRAATDLSRLNNDLLIALTGGK